MSKPIPPVQPFEALRHLRGDLGALEVDGLLRLPEAPEVSDSTRTDDARRCFCSNDYLGLGAVEQSVLADGGSGASRLVSGDHRSHGLLEQELAAWLGYPSALTFSSGYAANLGSLGCLLRPDDLVLSDALNHASIIDGIRLSKARATVVPHLELDAIAAALRGPRKGRAWVITESYFSMDGDSPDLRALRDLCSTYDAALVVDDAHAIGVFGPGGRGRCAEAGIVADVFIATFGKSLGTSGAAVLGPAELRLWLWNRARSFVFTTGPSPLAIEATRANLRRLQGSEDLRERLWVNVRTLRDGLATLGLEALGEGPIIPVLVGEPARAVQLARLLRAQGFRVSAIRPPTVPVGTSRLRFTVTASHEPADIAALLGALRAIKA